MSEATVEQIQKAFGGRMPTRRELQIFVASRLSRRERQQAEISRLAKQRQTKRGHPGSKKEHREYQQIIRERVESGEIPIELTIIGGTTVCRIVCNGVAFYGVAHVSYPDEMIPAKGVKIARGRAIARAARACAAVDKAWEITG